VRYAALTLRRSCCDWGVIMWIPAGLVYLDAGLGLTVAWVRTAERQDLAA
jgi:hypothetical protein